MGEWMGTVAWTAGIGAALIALGCAASPAVAGGEIYGAEPGYEMPADGEGANAEAEYIDGDRFGRRDYIQDGNRRGGQFGPGYYREGYYYPRQQYPDYWEYDAKRSQGSIWGFAVERVIVPVIPTDRELRAAGKFVARVRAAAHQLAREADDEWAGGEYDNPRTPLK